LVLLLAVPLLTALLVATLLLALLVATLLQGALLVLLALVCLVQCPGSLLGPHRSQ
jgi:hypothetical protein